MLQKKENEGFGFVLRGAKGKHDQNLHLSINRQVASGLNDVLIHDRKGAIHQRYNHIYSTVICSCLSLKAAC